MLLSVPGNALVARRGVWGVADSTFELKEASGLPWSPEGYLSRIRAVRDHRGKIVAMNGARKRDRAALSLIRMLSQLHLCIRNGDYENHLL